MVIQEDSLPKYVLPFVSKALEGVLNWYKLLGTIHILRQHIFGLFEPTHPLCQHKYSIENQQKSPFSEPTQSICWHNIWMVSGCSGLEAVAVCNADSLALDCDTDDPNWYEIEGKFNSGWDVSSLGLHNHLVVRFLGPAMLSFSF